MLETIVLLTGQFKPTALAAVLWRHNPKATIWPVATAGEIAVLKPDVLRRARLIAFVTPTIVPAEILDRLGYGAYNFHPGPPNYPGWAPTNFAIYHEATEFGATAHVMTERVDAGPIVGVRMFAIPPGSSLLELDQLGLVHTARLFWDLAKPLATQSEPLAELPISWSGRKTSRRQYAEMCDIPLNISKEELNRRLKAFGGNYFDMNPTIHLHGTEFQLAVKNVTPSDLSAEVLRLAQTHLGPMTIPPAPEPRAADLR